MAIEDVFALARAVKARPILYDPDHPGFGDKDLEEDAWKSIRAEIKPNYLKSDEPLEPHVLLKNTWGKIRDMFVKYVAIETTHPFGKYRDFFEPFFFEQIKQFQVDGKTPKIE